MILVISLIIDHFSHYKTHVLDSFNYILIVRFDVYVNVN